MWDAWRHKDRIRITFTRFLRTEKHLPEIGSGVNADTSAFKNSQVFIGLGYTLTAGRFYKNGIFYSDSSPSGQIDSRFNGEDHARFYVLLSAE